MEQRADAFTSNFRVSKFMFVSVYLSMTEGRGGIQRMLGGDLLGIGEGNVADGGKGNAMMTRRYFLGE